jgi:hypothetical protein
MVLDLLISAASIAGFSTVKDIPILISNVNSGGTLTVPALTTKPIGLHAKNLYQRIKKKLLMGMFDYVIVNLDQLPITDKEKKFLGKTPDFQTKCFDCTLTEVYITDDGELQIRRFEHEIVPVEERPYPDRDDLLGLCGMLREINVRLEVIPFHGYFNFYTTLENNEWLEFTAKFTDGKLQYVERLSANTHLDVEAHKRKQIED